jgi:cell division protein FtsI (penicillin-binding protein 3)/stage V sporulation protein D (sporulation-specific penicillin-binding protein)
MSLRSRACLACYGIGSIFTVLSARLVYLGVNQHEHYADIARKSYMAKVGIPARRGTIQDAEGTFLARNEPLKNVILDGSLVGECKHNRRPEQLKTPEQVAALLAESLGMKAADVLDRINPAKKYVVLKKKISEELAAALDLKLQRAGVKGVTFEQDFERIYPAHQMLCHVLGFYGYEETNAETHEGGFRGIEGVERSMDSWLRGQDGWRYFEKDGRGKELMNYTGEERAPRHGADVRLTVNLNLQQIVESELESACKRLRPIKATVIMMRPDTGEILALANRPTFDPNEPGKAKPEHRLNYAIAGTIEPGSTFKAITCAGALSFHLVTPFTEIYCENGRWLYGGLALHDHHPYGMLSVSQIIEHSSNIGAAKLAVQIGQERFYNLVRKFGFGQRTGVALPGEVPGILRPREKWEPASITRVAMGHEVAATPLQIITATCAIANGGRLMMPQLIHEIRSDSGEVIAKFQPQEVRRVITGDTAGKVRDALIKVTGKQGTAKLAHIPGYETAGKTGTAQKLVEDPKTGKKYYSHDRHVTSFVGFVPAQKPAFCLLVVIDEAKVDSSQDVGGLVAAPVFRTIAERSLSYLGVAPDPVLLQQEKDQKAILAKTGRN